MSLLFKQYVEAFLEEDTEEALHRQLVTVKDQDYMKRPDGRAMFVEEFKTRFKQLYLEMLHRGVEP